MGLTPENGSERLGQPNAGPHPLVRGGVGHERLTPLVLRAQQGDPEAQSQVVAELSPGVLRALTALLGRTHPDLEDLAQDVLLAVLSALPDFRGESTLLHFAVRIAARKSVLVKRRGHVRAGKLYYLRGLEGKKARIKEDLAGNAKAKAAAAAAAE